jgi:hypothetical protein
LDDYCNARHGKVYNEKIFHEYSPLGIDIYVSKDTTYALCYLKMCSWYSTTATGPKIVMAQ